MSTTYSLVATEIIDEAFDLCAIGSEGEDVTADMYARAFRSLNLLIKNLEATEHLWQRTEGTLALVAGTASYCLGADVLRVIEARRSNTASAIETPLSMWAREQYLEMPNKAAQSIPTAFYFDKQQDNGTVYLWPTPSTDVASAYTVKYSYLRKISDVVNSNDTADVPQAWLMSLTYLLAAELALKYGCSPQRLGIIQARANELRAGMEAFDTEPASLFLQPDDRG
jgi:hypothetical protein